MAEGGHASPSRTNELTERETEILKMVAKGMSYKQIAERLVLSHRTVQNHVQNTLRKLQMHNRVELTRYAIERGSTSDDDDAMTPMTTGWTSSAPATRVRRGGADRPRARRQPGRAGPRLPGHAVPDGRGARALGAPAGRPRRCGSRCAVRRAARRLPAPGTTSGSRHLGGASRAVGTRAGPRPRSSAATGVTPAVVLVENHRARGLYEHLGWTPTGREQSAEWPPYPVEMEYGR